MLKTEILIYTGPMIGYASSALEIPCGTDRQQL